MKNYIISEEQLKKIIEQIDDDQNSTENEEDETTDLFGDEDVDMSKNKEITLDDNDPIQQVFNSLI